MEILVKSLKRSSLGLDLYLWLTYRTFALKRPLRLTWPQLYRQFGTDPAKSSDTRTVDALRTDCLRELKKIKDAWPDLHYQTVKGALWLSCPRRRASRRRNCASWNSPQPPGVGLEVRGPLLRREGMSAELY